MRNALTPRVALSVLLIMALFACFTVATVGCAEKTGSCAKQHEQSKCKATCDHDHHHHHDHAKCPSAAKK